MAEQFIILPKVAEDVWGDDDCGEYGTYETFADALNAAAGEATWGKTWGVFQLVNETLPPPSKGGNNFAGLDDLTGGTPQ